MLHFNVHRVELLNQGVSISFMVVYDLLFSSASIFFCLLANPSLNDVVYAAGSDLPTVVICRFLRPRRHSPFLKFDRLWLLDWLPDVVPGSDSFHLRRKCLSCSERLDEFAFIVVL